MYAVLRNINISITHQTQQYLVVVYEAAQVCADLVHAKILINNITAIHDS